MQEILHFHKIACILTDNSSNDRHFMSENTQEKQKLLSENTKTNNSSQHSNEQWQKSYSDMQNKRVTEWVEA